MLLLYGSTLDEAHRVVARIRAELRAPGHGLVAWPLTVSAGLTGGSVPDDDGVLRSWLEAADQALLRAKQAGRDRVEVATVSLTRGW